MKVIWFLLLLIFTAILGGCAGNTNVVPQERSGILFSRSTSQAALEGDRADMLVVVQPVSNSEFGQPYHATASATGGADIVNPSWDGTIDAHGNPSFHVVAVQVPPQTAVGTHITVTVTRTSTVQGTFGVQLQDSFDLIVDTAKVSGQFTGSGDTLQGAPNSTVTTTLTLTPFGAASGHVAFEHELPGVSVTPSSGTITAGQPFNAQVSFHIPSTAHNGDDLDFPVFFSTTTNEGFAILHVHVGQQSQGDFTLELSRQEVFVNPGGDSDQVTVTANPQSGFTGLITVTVTFSDNRYSVASPQTNPFTINVVGANPGTASFKVHEAAAGVARGVQFPTATVTATGGGHTHTATVTIRPLS